MKLKNLLITLTAAILLISCNQDEIYDVTNEDLNQSSAKSTARIMEGIIPFTVENVQKALPTVLQYYSENRPEVAKRFENYKVEPTHIYYKFTPADSLQYSLLMEKDEELQLTVDPFEFTPKERTEDPGENEIPSFYAVVSKEIRIPNVTHETLALLHFTDEDKLEDVSKNYDEIEFKQNLMYETRKIAGHLDEEELAEGYMNYREGIEENKTQKGNVTTKGLFGKKWRPSGSIRVEEDVLTALQSGTRFYVPVRGVQVNVLKWGWLQVEHGTTDNNGNFSTGTTYTKEVWYNVKFKGTYAKVKEGDIFDMANWKSGKHKRSALNINFNSGTREHFHALVFNAAYDYFTRVIPLYNLTYPHYPVSINARYNSNNSEFIAPMVPFTSTVKIGRLKGGLYRNSDGIYGTTVHELTHASHYALDSGIFTPIKNREQKLMRESYAEGAETVMTNQRYRMLFGTGYRGSYRENNTSLRHYNAQFESTTVLNMNAYTPLVYDLTDNLNQNTLIFNDGRVLPVDRVSGYTLKQIQDAMKNTRKLNTWKQNLINNYHNSTEIFIDDVFNYANEALNNSWN